MTSKRSRTAFETDLQQLESPYAFYGSPLPPLDEHTRDDGSYVPVWKQEIVDDRGRKRLHGAFTGGFSAGYYNTVGSKEGWTPSTFVSSRQNRQKDGAKVTQQRPEDFMDDEDVREAEESRGLHTANEFAGFGSTEADTMRLGGLTDLFKTMGETIGVKLLKKMGWKDGQGIGPRIRKKATVQHEKLEPAGTYLVAPQDAEMISFSQKTDQKGLGYSIEDRLPSAGYQPKAPKARTAPQSRGDSDEEDAASPFPPISSRTKIDKKSGKRSGFGVGILNDTGSDDEDPYEMGPKISYNKTIGATKKTKKKESVLGSSNPLLKEKPFFVSKKINALKSASGFRKCHDGRFPLDGFILATESNSYASVEASNENYKPPEVPTNWKTAKAPNINPSEPQYLSTKEAAKASSLDAKSRGALLGESQLPGKSVFDFLTPAARDRLAAASGNNSLPAALGEKAPDGYAATEEDKARADQDLVPLLNTDVANQALSRGLSGWMPYAEDESKRSRYRAYLEIRAGIRDGLPLRPPLMSKEDWIIEMQEFARAAQVFKPVTGVMASRFVSSTQPKDAPDASDASTRTESLLSKPAAKPDDPAEVAAGLGMFGPLTRSVLNFYPTRLLCKRFNVKPPANVQLDPGDDPGVQGGTDSRDHGRLRPTTLQLLATSYIELDSENVTDQTTTEAGSDAFNPKSDERIGIGQGVSTAKPVIIDASRNEALEADRPGQAVFKAIFGSDDEDE